MTSSKSEMSVQYIHNVYSMDKTKLAELSDAKRGANAKKSTSSKTAKAAAAKVAPVK